MITIFIFFVLAFIITYRNLSKEECISKKDNIFFSFLFGLISAGCGAMFSIFIPQNTYFEKSTFELESISDGSKLNGQFFLGSGYINEKMKYSFYLKEQEGFKLYTIDADIAHVRYSKTNPVLEMYEQTRTNDFINYFSIPHRLELKYIIYVPQGSILQNYVLDAQ